MHRPAAQHNHESVLNSSYFEMAPDPDPKTSEGFTWQNATLTGEKPSIGTDFGNRQTGSEKQAHATSIRYQAMGDGEWGMGKLKLKLGYGIWATSNEQRATRI